MPTPTSYSDLIKQGLADLHQGNYQSVHKNAIAMIHADVNNPVAYLLLGKLAAEHSNYSKALELLRRASDLAPDNAYCQVYLAQLLSTLSHQNFAKDIADQAASLRFEDAHLADTLGVVYSRTGFHEMAIPWFEKAVAIDDAPANFHYNLAASQQFIGDFDAAENAYRATIKRDGSTFRAWSSLVSLKRQTHTDNHLESLIPLFERMSEQADASLHLGHAIAKTYEDLGQHELSLEWLHRAKKLKQQALEDSEIPYPPIFAAAKNTAITESAPPTISADLPRSQASPIFVVGLPRTGTTLVDRIISSHPDVHAAGELNTFANLVKQATATASSLTMDANTFTKALDIDLSKVGADYIKGTDELRRGARRCTDKMPLNFFYAGLIHQALPNAKIIVLRRGAMDSCLSNYRQLLTTQQSYYQYTYSLKDTAQFYAMFNDLIQHWEQHLPAHCLMQVRYEDIVFDQENQTRRLLQFCDLSWDEACLRFHENDAPVSTASSVQVRQPLYSGSIGRWKKYGSALDTLRSALGVLAD